MALRVARRGYTGPYTTPEQGRINLRVHATSNFPLKGARNTCSLLLPFKHRLQPANVKFAFEQL